MGGQRVAAFRCTCPSPHPAGKTVYERGGLTVAGEVGTGVLHYNVPADGEPNELSLHGAAPYFAATNGSGDRPCGRTACIASDRQGAG